MVSHGSKKTMKAKLDRSERAIEGTAEAYRPVREKQRQKIETILERSRKPRRLTTRKSKSTLST
jgi:hypothetical protein